MRKTDEKVNAADKKPRLKDEKIAVDTKAIFEYDRQFLPSVIAGTDEAGRGPLAGPVVCAACVMPMDGDMIDGIFDSKRVGEAKRERLFELITSRALSYHIAVIDRETIDGINILQATKLGMKQAVEGLSVQPDLLLADAVTKLDIAVPYRSIIKGDAKSYHIAAASILAKVYRDRLMRKMDADYPQYGFASNKGYGTPEHIRALLSCGACPQHRVTFIKNFTGEQREQQTKG